MSLNRLLRLSVVLLTVAALAAPLGACGKKSRPEKPEGSTYPQQYPAQ